MFYQERVINGILCYRTNPSGEWNEFTKEHLTKRLELAEARVNACVEALNKPMV